MKKWVSTFLIIFTLLCGNVFAADEYTIIDFSEFADVGEFSEGLCAVKDTETSRWGFVDINKNWVITPQFKNASYFKNGLCAVNTADGESVLINRSGNIIFKRSEYDVSASSDDFYIEKHGKYFILLDDYRITLIDENYHPITVDDVELWTFSGKSKTLFWENNQQRVYNYKGTDITDKLTNENVDLSRDMSANNKYIIGQTDDKIKCFDIHGNKIAEFNENNYTVRLHGDLILCNNKVYNIARNQTLFAPESDNIDDIQIYYNKYFTVKKHNGTSALYSADGKILVEFGAWDYIYPSSVSKNIIVATNGKYGIADYDGNLLIPLEYTPRSTIHAVITEDGRYAMLKKNMNSYIIDLSTLKCREGLSFISGNRYLYSSDKILDNSLNLVYEEANCHFGNDEKIISRNLKNGVMRHMFLQKPAAYNLMLLNDPGINIEIDKTALVFDVLPIIQNGRTLVPMRAIFEALGANVEWNGNTQTVFNL